MTGQTTGPTPARPGLRRPVVTVTVWGVAPKHVPGAFFRMGLLRGALKRSPGLRFAKLLGTGEGRTFDLRDADALHWGLIAVWDDDAAADAAPAGRVHRSWDRIARERLDVSLDPISSRGSWAGVEPFGPQDMGAVTPIGNAPVAAITRAKLRLRNAPSFWRAVPPVSADLSEVPGLHLAIGIGEAPVGLQGTFSLWNSSRELGEFAYKRAAHADVVRRTGPERWYVEELFARFRVRSISGTFKGAEVHLPAPDRPS